METLKDRPDSPPINYSYFDYIKISGRVFRDKLWYSLWHFDLFETVKRTYPEEAYHSSLSSLLSSNPTLVDDNLYLGNAFNAADYQWLSGHDIKTIVNVTPSISNYYPEDFNYYDYCITDLDGSSLRPYYEQFYKTVMENSRKNHNLFVHCFAGKSRSAAMVLFYFRRKYKLDTESALERLKELRPCINVNESFIEEINELFKANPDWSN